MELKIAQELASVDQYPLLLVCFDLSKAYKHLDKGGATTNSRRLWGGTNTTGITSVILVNKGSSHLSECVSWLSVPSDKRENTRGAGLAYTHSVIQIRHP